MMEERRQQSRRQADESLFVRDSRTGDVIGQIADMTEHGVMLVSEKPTQPHTTVQCRMTLPETMEGHDFVSFTAESKWCKLDEETGMYQTGYEFRDLTPDQQAMIKTLVASWSVPQPKPVRT